MIYKASFRAVRATQKNAFLKIQEERRKKRKKKRKDEEEEEMKMT